MIKRTNTVNEILGMNPSFKDVFSNNGFVGLDNPHILKQIGNLTLEQLLAQKGKSVEVFISLLEEMNKKETVDITLESGVKEAETKILGLLPCPVRIPLLETFDSKCDTSKVNYELKAASEGLDWLKEDMHSASNEDDLADIYISAGFDLFFEKDFVKKFKNTKTFSDFGKDLPFNKDFENDSIQLRDPNGDYSMFSVVPAVFLVNTLVLGDRPMPKTWKDLLDPIYEGSVSLPGSDFDLFNAIMIHIYKEYGEAGVLRLGKQMIASMHPAQMVKSDRRSRVKPAISIMPYFFTRMALAGSLMKAVWPEDGAIVSPIFMLTKTSKKEQLKQYTDIFFSKEVGEILSHKGLFPSTHALVDNKLDNKPFFFVGWDYINNNDIGAILKKCEDLFEKGMSN